MKLFWSALALVLGTGSVARATPELRFDVITFCCGCADSPICQYHLDHLNVPTTNGYYVAMGSDAHRMELATNGNGLAVYYNTFNNGYSTNSGAEQAAMIDAWVVPLFTTTGPKPTWIVLNEISTSLWQNEAAYRVWVHDVAHALRTTYGYNVILYSPFAHPGANNTDWQNVATEAYIGIENYLSGTEVQSSGFSVSYCQGQYQSSISSYTARGVARGKLMLGEHFAHTTNGTLYGRAGVSSNNWDTTIITRNQAAVNVGFAGFLSYSWGGNGMGVSTNEQLHAEDTYATNRLPVNNGVTAPFALIQPQGQTVPEGSAVSFTVFKAGNAPTSYQWRFNGTNLAGATTSSLDLASIGVTNAGNYSVRLSNSAGITISSNAFLSVRVPDPIAYDPFAPATTIYAVGANLIGQTNATGQYWTQAGPAGNQPVIQPGNLAVGGLAGPWGNSVKLGGSGMSARFNMITNTATGTWYYSFAFRLLDISTLNSGGVFWAGFNNSQGTQLTTPTSVATRLLTRSAIGGYNIGLDKTSGNAGGFVFSPTVFTTNDTVFVVGSYTFNSGSTTDDLSQMWLNPSPSAFGLGSPPPPTLSNLATNDISPLIGSFVLFNRNGNEPAVIIADEVRVGPSWASVTPPAEAPLPPSLSITRSASTDVLSWTTNAPGFLLESEPALTNPGSWSSVIAPVYVVGSQFVVTNTTTNGLLFYRLREPQ